MLIRNPVAREQQEYMAAMLFCLCAMSSSMGSKTNCITCRGQE